MFNYIVRTVCAISCIAAASLTFASDSLEITLPDTTLWAKKYVVNATGNYSYGTSPSFFVVKHAQKSWNKPKEHVVFDRTNGYKELFRITACEGSTEPATIMADQHLVTATTKPQDGLCIYNLRRHNEPFTAYKIPVFKDDKKCVEINDLKRLFNNNNGSLLVATQQKFGILDLVGEKISKQHTVEAGIINVHQASDPIIWYSHYRGHGDLSHKALTDIYAYDARDGKSNLIVEDTGQTIPIFSVTPDNAQCVLFKNETFHIYDVRTQKRMLMIPRKDNKPALSTGICFIHNNAFLYGECDDMGGHNYVLHTTSLGTDFIKVHTTPLDKVRGLHFIPEDSLIVGTNGGMTSHNTVFDYKR